MKFPLRHHQLERGSRDRLREMSVSDSLIEPFLDHPHLTPRHRTAITLALQKLRSTRYRGNYIRLTLSACSEEDAFFFPSNAAILALYHRKHAKILSIVDCNGIPAGYTAERRLAMPMLLDYGSWTQLDADFVDTFISYNRPDLEIDSREIVLTGTLTPRAKQEAEACGVIVTEKAFPTLAP